MLRRLSRYAAAFGVALALASPVFAQYPQQQKTDELGLPSAPSTAQPLSIPQVQSPTITNNPDYPRQPISPGQVAPPQQAQPRVTPPQTPASEQRGRGAFTAPGVTRDLSLAERNEFQDFIWASTGQILPLFGHNLFEAPSTFAPVENIPVTPDYVIGPGDELLIRAWGQIEVDYRAVVDRNGMINVPRVGSVPVAGVRYQDITDQIRKAIARNFRNFELAVSMGQLRSVQIFVVGQARRPGNYTVSSLSTLVNAIFAAGGPSTRGSMRAIQLKRGNTVVTEFDVYELLLAGDKSRDASLL